MLVFLLQIPFAIGIQTNGTTICYMYSMIYCTYEPSVNTSKHLGFFLGSSSSMELNVEEFLLGNVLDAVVSQVMMLLKEKKLQLVCEIPEEIKTLPLSGDQIKLQQVLSDFLHNIVHHAPSSDGWIEIKISTGLKMIQDFNEFIHLQFRYHGHD